MKKTRAELIDWICKSVGITDRQPKHAGYLRRIDLHIIAGWIRGKSGVEDVDDTKKD